MIKYCGIFFILFFTQDSSATVPLQKVLFIDPVVNLCSKKLSTYGVATQALYDDQPLSSVEGAYSCMRTAQALFNEVGTVIEWDTKTHEICVELPHFIIDHNGSKKCPKFWCWDSHVIKHDVEKESLKNNGTKKYLMLCQPFFDNDRGIAYSVGTKFLRVPENDAKNGYGIEFFAPELKKNIRRIVPATSVIIPDPTISCKNRRLACRDLIRSWLGDQENGEIIPYVWGGASYIDRFFDEPFEKQEGSFFDKTTCFWMRKNIQQPYGFDCSSLILRAAQIIGIPYFYKTSHAAYVLGKVVTDIRKISVGDLIVWPGHMMFISDLKKGLIIESKGYNAGFGMLHERPLSKCFKDISSYRKLFKAYKDGSPLYELDAAGTIIKTIPEFKIISLCGDRCCERNIAHV